MALVKASRFSSEEPWLGQKTLSYFPAKEVPKLSSSKLEERTIKGWLPALSRRFCNCSKIFVGNLPSRYSFWICGYSARICSSDLYFWSFQQIRLLTAINVYIRSEPR